jgi:hypothetical protein
MSRGVGAPRGASGSDRNHPDFWQAGGDWIEAERRVRY